MRKFPRLLLSLTIANPILVPHGVFAGEIKLNFGLDAADSVPSSLACAVGTWVVTQDEGRPVLKVDGSRWKEGASSVGLPEISKALFGSRGAEFMDGVKAYAFFPFAVIRAVARFQEGDVSFRFKTLAGRIDQAAGIAFDIKPGGDYLILRANALENNLVLFQVKKGKRSPLKWVRNTPTGSGLWHSLRLTVKDRGIEGFLDNESLLRCELPNPVDGRVGLWSKADSVVVFGQVQVRVDR